MTFKTYFTLAGIGSMLLLGAFALAPLQTLANNTENPRILRPALPGLEISMRGNGSVLVRGAKVTSVSGSTVVATTAWGSANITWTIRTASSTNIVRHQEGRAMLSDIGVDDVISFSGTLDTTQSAFTVNAKVIRDWSLPEENAVIRGTVTTVNTANHTFTMLAGTTTVTVHATSTTAITENGEASNFLAISVDDTVAASGSYDAGSLTMTASRVVIGGAAALNASDKKIGRDILGRLWDNDWFSRWFKRK